MKAFGRLLMLALGLGAALPGTLPSASAQGPQASGPAAPTRPIEPREFLRLAYSSASLQAQAARLVAGRDARPEIKDYAAAEAGFRATLLQRLETFARERNLPLPAAKEFEHQVILENLEPLDSLELSRRYAEAQVQVLGQEIGIYRAAGRSPDHGINAFAAEALPQLQQRLESARNMFEAVRP